MMRNPRTYSFLVVPLLIILWQIAAAGGYLSELIPTPVQVAGTLADMTANGTIMKHLANSTLRLFAGLLLAIVLGVVSGTFLGIWPVLYNLFSPLLSFFISIPTVAWVPLLLVIFGLGTQTVIIAVFLGGFFEITYSTLWGIRTVPRSLIDASRTMGASPFRVFTSTLLPGALISFIPALRLAMGYSWRALVGAEMLSSMIRWGLGKMIFEARYWNDLAVMFVGLACIWAVASIFEKLVGLLERRTLGKWGLIKRT